jgi:hypothetical protein
MPSSTEWLATAVPATHGPFSVDPWFLQSLHPSPAAPSSRSTRPPFGKVHSPSAGAAARRGASVVPPATAILARSVAGGRKREEGGGPAHSLPSESRTVGTAFYYVRHHLRKCRRRRRRRRCAGRGVIGARTRDKCAVRVGMLARRFRLHTMSVTRRLKTSPRRAAATERTAESSPPLTTSVERTKILPCPTDALVDC